MNTRKIKIENIPAILWGELSDKIYILCKGEIIYGKNSSFNTCSVSYA